MAAKFFSVDQLRDRLRRECMDAGSQREWARQAGVSDAYLSDVLSGRRRPGPTILRALGMRAEERFVAE